MPGKGPQSTAKLGTDSPRSNPRIPAPSPCLCVSICPAPPALHWHQQGCVQRGNGVHRGQGHSKSAAGGRRVVRGECAWCAPLGPTQCSAQRAGKSAALQTGPFAGQGTKRAALLATSLALPPPPHIIAFCGTKASLQVLCWLCTAIVSPLFIFYKSNTFQIKSTQDCFSRWSVCPAG